MRPEVPPSSDVVVVGGGPAGLSAASELRRQGVESVVLVERDRDLGGVPRFCHHQGFGIKDLRRPLSGPAYAEHLVGEAAAAGVTMLTETTVQSIDPQGVQIAGPIGRMLLPARAVLVATGVRERPRSARMVPGDRPFGVFTTGQLQQWVHGRHLAVGSRAVVVGAEHVSFSAAMVLRQAGVKTLAMITEMPAHQSIQGAAMLAKIARLAPLMTSTRLVEISGRDRVAAVTVEGVDGRVRAVIEVDTVVFTGDWVPDAELVRRSGVLLDPGTRGPVVDWVGATSREGIFAAGNLVYPAETASIAALDGRRVGLGIAERLEGRVPASVAEGVAVTGDPSIRWIAPQRVVPTQAPQEFALRTARFSSGKTIVVRQGVRVLGRYRLRHSTPNRGLSVPGDWVASIEGSQEVVISCE